MAYENAAKHRMLDALVGTASGSPITHASLHDADPAGSGGDELSGGSPAYARKSITFGSAGAAVNGTVDSSNTPVFDVPAGSTVAYVGFWTAITSGTFMATANVTDEVYGGQGTYTATDADLDLNS